MTRKSLGLCVLLLWLLLGSSSNAYADAISMTSVTLSNFQLVPTSGTIVFSTPQTGSRTAASAVAINSFDEESANQSQSLTRSEASASVTFATANAVSDFTNLSFSANSNVMLSGCLCQAESEGLANLTATFMIAGGSGNVDVNFSGLLQTMQNLMTDQFSLFAASDARFSLQVLDVSTFSVDSTLRIGPNDFTTLENQRQLSQVFNLQFNQEYTLLVTLSANSRAAQNEVPEPATVVLLGSGLACVAGFVRKRRAMR